VGEAQELVVGGPTVFAKQRQRTDKSARPWLAHQQDEASKARPPVRLSFADISPRTVVWCCVGAMVLMKGPCIWEGEAKV
jgi:hypothetical protein